MQILYSCLATFFVCWVLFYLILNYNFGYQFDSKFPILFESFILSLLITLTVTISLADAFWMLQTNPQLVHLLS